MAIVLTEAWLKENIPFGAIPIWKVRALGLPGTSGDKISKIGDALLNFKSLQILDLSRNVLNTLEGLQHAPLLEKLYLKNNKIGSLREVKWLTELKHLKEVDMRLNPVTKIAKNYRLFVVHHISPLKILDDMKVRMDERRDAKNEFGEVSVFQTTPKSLKTRRKTEKIKSNGDETGADGDQVQPPIEDWGEIVSDTELDNDSKATPYADMTEDKEERRREKGLRGGETHQVKQTKTRDDSSDSDGGPSANRKRKKQMTSEELIRAILEHGADLGVHLDGGKLGKLIKKFEKVYIEERERARVELDRAKPSGSSKNITQLKQENAKLKARIADLETSTQTKQRNQTSSDITSDGNVWQSQMGAMLERSLALQEEATKQNKALIQQNEDLRNKLEELQLNTSR